ncbi:1,4-dihydroxy-2-naphthoyl-CoA hydrolase [Stieleria maiorica]|uniref:1,4-dihydroxy-2-naphthoyl-CoA hydrolase n=1 Tax=Stieleria maiorica TaxID=2795974 RepID=A0A5B9MIY0_9BACT|nr:thioesterase family protein [Stieleria maiorica]QEG01212.1 1,4-dihydroxy-2-naphthoyl-CoA hydrolase [Stieleria maiorica]
MSFRTRRMVEFRDTDAAGIVHFSAFFPWMESAEHEMLRSLGIKVLPESHDDPSVTWPRVSVSCDYANVARFEDWLDIDVSVVKTGRSSVQYRLAFSRQGGDGGVIPIATGTIVAVCCRLRPGGGLEKAVIPDDIRAKLDAV